MIHDLSRLDRYDRNLPAESWCAGCGHELDDHTHLSDSSHCTATVDTWMQSNVLRTRWCDCEAFTAPAWTWRQRAVVAVIVATCVAVVAATALGMGR